MRNILVVLIFMFFWVGLNGEDILELNFFIEPKFLPVNINMVNFLVQNIRNDSIRQFNIFAGKMLNSSQSDSLTLHFLNLIKPDLASPTDYLFTDFDLRFDLLMSNVKCDSVTISDRYIIETDSLKIGIFSIYTPDWTVKNKLPDYVNFDFDFFELTGQIARDLASKADFIVLLSNLSQFVDTDLIHSLPIDVVVSFDYQKKNNLKLNRGKSSFYSVLTNQGKYGKLRLVYQQGKISQAWQEVDFQAGK